MKAGKRVTPATSLADVRTHAASELARLPEPLRRLEPHIYPVTIADALTALGKQALAG